LLILPATFGVLNAAEIICHVLSLSFRLSDEKRVEMPVMTVGCHRLREKKRAPVLTYNTRDGLRSATMLRVTEKWDEHVEEESV
jgi:hypothetical protein